MARDMHFQLQDNIFIETKIQSPDYDGVVLILYPEKCNISKPKLLESFIEKLSTIDKNLHKAVTLWNCDNVPGGRLILSPTGEITPYKDVKIVKDAAKKGMIRATEAGCRKPLIIVQNIAAFPGGQLVAILGTLEALYNPLQMRERDATKSVTRIGFYSNEENDQNFEKVIRNAIALERARILTRDIAGSDPERMSPQNVVEYVKDSFKDDANVSVKVVEDVKVIQKEYPLLAAVSRAANQIERHRARILQLEYNPPDSGKVKETVILVGKGVTYDTGGADIKISGKMTGMSRDKSGAAAVAGFIKACSILKPSHLKAVGVLCLCRNSVGEDSYVTDELLVSRGGKTVRVTNTDAEGRFAMADSLFEMAELAMKELNPHIYTVATLTGHARACYGNYIAAMDNHSARAANHSNGLQDSGSIVGEGVEVSTIRHEDLQVNVGKAKGDDLIQIDMDVKCRHHQLAAGFLIKVAGMEDKNIKYTHLDIAGAAGIWEPEEPPAVPVLTLCHLHRVLL